MNNISIAYKIIKEKDEIKRFELARSYLDLSNAESIDKNILKFILDDDADFVRAEGADFLIVCGGLPSETIIHLLKNEKSDMVYPRLWLALAISSPAEIDPILSRMDINSLPLYERCFYDAAMFHAGKNPFYLYDLCAMAFVQDVPASYTSIDLLRIVADDRADLLQQVVLDLELIEAETAQKASQQLIGHIIEG